MPNSLQDLGPDPTAEAVGKFGRGFSNRFAQNRRQEIESDALEDIFSKVKPDSSPTDVLSQIFTARDLNFDQKKATAHSISEVLEKTQKARKDQIDEAKRGQTKDKLLKAGLPEPLADLYSEATTGGQTELIKYLRDQAERGGEDYLSKLIAGDPKVMNQISEEGEEVNEFDQAKRKFGNPEKIVDFDKGLKPTERVKRQDSRYAKGLPFVENLSKQLSAGQRETKALTNLETLNQSDQIGKNIWNINPFTGDLLVPALATPEQQLYQKTVNDFISRAKEFFGARVTNFDLERFMARLPTLGNSKEGRAAIIKEMGYAQELMNLENSALTDVIEEYGIRNIDIPDAERIAKKRTEKDRERIDKEILNLEKVLNRDEKTQIDQYKKKAPKGHVLMRTPEGKLKYFPQKNAKSLQEKNYEKL